MQIKFLDLPPVPEELIEPIDVIINKPFRATSAGLDNRAKGVFQRRDVSPELHNYLQTLFDFKIKANYQILYLGTRLHKDIGRDIAYNYLIDLGGDNIVTSVFDGWQDDKKLLQSEILPLKKWHSLNVSNYHQVDGLIEGVPRVAISVNP